MFKVLVDGCEPTRGTEFSACVDLYASEDITIYPGDTEMIGLGVAIDDEYFDVLCETFGEVDRFKKSHYLQLMLRSSLGKKGLILPNGVGIIDMDYRDEIKLLVHNPFSDIHITRENTARPTGVDNKYKIEINKGDRIAQVTILEHKGFLMGIESKEKRDGGFGSTDKKDFYDLKYESEEDGRNL